MSDFLFSGRRRGPGTLQSILERRVGAEGTVWQEEHGAFGSIAVAAPPHEPEVSVAEEGQLSVLPGRPLVRDGAARVRTDGLPRTAGRAAAHQLLVGAALAAADRSAGSSVDVAANVAWADRLDGSFAALALRADGSGLLVTDLFAWVPVFQAEAEDGTLVLGTHVDAVATAAGRAADVDPVSVVELILFQQVTWPATMYRGVTQVIPASERRLVRGRWSGEERIYWAPREDYAYRREADAAEALRTALIADVRAACAGEERVGVLLSGGEDSRVILGALPEGVAADGFTLSPTANRELRSARRVGRAYGARVTWGERPEDHDVRHLAAVATLVGSGNQFTDLHTYPFHRTLGLDRLPVVLGGLSSDALLKGDNISHSARRHGPGYRGPMRAPSAPGLRPELVEAALARRRGHLERVAALRPDSADEWFHIWPFTMRRYAANHHGNRRLFAVHEPFQSNDIVRIAARVPQAWKADRRLFTAAFRPQLARSWRLPHTRNRLPYFGPRVNRLVRGPIGLARRLKALATGEVGANQESWPDWTRVVASPAMEEALRRHPPLTSAVAQALTPGLEGEALDARRREWPAISQLSLLQLSFLLRPDRR